jgi:transposase
MRQKEEVTLLQEENARLREENLKLLQQVSDLSKQVKDLSGQVEHLRDQLAKDSHNSHKPPSSERFRRKPKSLRKKSGKKAGGQPGHQGNTLMQVAVPDQVIVHEVSTCAQCQRDLSQVPPLSVQTRQVLDLPIKRVVVVEHQAEEKCGPACCAITVAPFPQEVKAPVQYSAALAAIGVYLVQQQVLPYERACELMLDLLGVSMSTGELATLVQRTATALGPVEEAIKEALAKGEVLHQDETGCRVTNKQAYVHVSSTSQLTHYAASTYRGQKALQEIGLLKTFRGTLVHDGYRSYFLLGKGKHGLCNVHLLRDLTFLVEEKNQAWAALMTDLLLEMKQAVHSLKEAGQTQMRQEEVDDWRTRYRDLLQQGYQAHQQAPLPAKPPPKPRQIVRRGRNSAKPSQTRKGKTAQSPSLNLLERLTKYEEAVLAFVLDFRVPFSNNQAERDLRMVKVQQKISGCFRSWRGVQAFCRIRGYLSCLRKQGLPLLTALEQTLLGHPLLPVL